MVDRSNPLTAPQHGQSDPLPKWLRETIESQRKHCKPPDEREQIRAYIGLLTFFLKNGAPLDDGSRAFLTKVMSDISAGANPEQAIFGKKKPGRKQIVTDRFIVELVNTIWHNKRLKLRVQRPAIAYIAEDRPAWLAPTQMVAFEWVADYLGLTQDEVRKRFRAGCSPEVEARTNARLGGKKHHRLPP